jgi:molybdate transport system substrate-binding protein
MWLTRRHALLGRQAVDRALQHKDRAEFLLPAHKTDPGWEGNGRRAFRGTSQFRPSDHRSVAARSGAPKPDISSVDAFKHTLLNARSIVYADPAKGGVSGVHFARVLDRLNIAEPMKGKTILVPGAQAPEVVARGEAELGIAQGSEIVPVAGAQLLGPLPGDLASTTVFAAAIGAASKSPEAANSLIKFLTGPEAAPRLKAKGFEPG